MTVAPLKVGLVPVAAFTTPLVIISLIRFTAPREKLQAVRYYYTKGLEIQLSNKLKSKNALTRV